MYDRESVCSVTDRQGSGYNLSFLLEKIPIILVLGELVKIIDFLGLFCFELIGEDEGSLKSLLNLFLKRIFL
jgi:hypothetical protein